MLDHFLGLFGSIVDWIEAATHYDLAADLSCVLVLSLVDLSQPVFVQME